MNGWERWVISVSVLVLSAVAGGAFMHELTLRRYVGPASPRFMHSSVEDVRRALQLAGVKPGEHVYDLGCGDGRVPVTAAKEFGAIGVCVEHDASLLMDAGTNARLAGVRGSVELVHADLFSVPLYDADVVFLYLTPEFNERLSPILRERLRPGARVVSLAHPMPDDWRAVAEDRWRDEHGRARVLRLFVVPPRV